MSGTVYHGTLDSKVPRKTLSWDEVEMVTIQGPKSTYGSPQMVDVVFNINKSLIK